MGEVDDLVDVLERASVETAERLLRSSGAVAPPTVHLFSERHAQPYLGCVTTRPFYRGDDAAQAVTALGILPSVVRATRVVVTWEFHDLLVGLQDPLGQDPQCPNALVLVDALPRGHTVRWRPGRFLLPGEHGESSVMVPKWGRPAREVGGALPAPVAELLTVWREWHAGDVDDVRAQLVEMGFEIWWAADHVAAREAAG